MTVLNTKNQLAIEFGNTKSVLTAYKNKDSARAEFVPLSGEVIQFNIADDNVETLIYQGEVFVKMN